MAILGKLEIVDFQWFEHFWNHENMFETGVIRAELTVALDQEE